MNGQFEWSESGLRLLDDIKEIIHNEGGRFALAKSIMREHRDYFNSHVKAERQKVYNEKSKSRKAASMIQQDKIIEKYWATHTLQEIADKLNIHYSCVSLRGKALNLPARSRTTHIVAERGKPVIITLPKGEKKCWTISEAAKELQANQGSVSRAIKKGYLVNGYRVRLAEAV